MAIPSERRSASTLKRDRGPSGRLSYAWQRSREQPSGALLTNSPRHMAKAAMAWPLLGKRLTAGLDGWYLSARARTLAGAQAGSSTSRQPHAGGSADCRAASTSPPASTTSSTQRYADPGAPEHRAGSHLPGRPQLAASSWPSGSESARREAESAASSLAAATALVARGHAEPGLRAARPASRVPGEGGLPLSLRGIRGVAARLSASAVHRSPSASWAATLSVASWTRRSWRRWRPDARCRPALRRRRSSRAVRDPLHQLQRDVPPARRSWPGCRHAPVLTVGEADRFARRGGMIGFFFEDNRVRLEVNRAAAERAGLRVSSKLLAVARLVKPDAAESGGSR